MNAPRPAAELASALGLTFRDRSLLESALRHPSYRNEEVQRLGTRQGVADDNARLEFLGDAVLGLVLSEWLFARHAAAQEGELTVERARHTDKSAVARVARSVDIGAYLSMGKGESANKSELAIAKREGDALEALVGAVYLDAGYAAATALVRMLWARGFDGSLLPAVRVSAT